jgi:GNAT superfamily N-acetyltransferase
VDAANRTSRAMFDVRQATTDDEDLIRALRLRAVLDSPEAFASTYERELSRTADDWSRWISPGVTFFFRVDGEARGLVYAGRDLHEASIVNLMAMWVAPNLRRAGAPDLLVSAVSAWALEKGATEIRLNVFQANHRARRCYERLGFRATGRRDAMERNEQPNLEMALIVSTRT